MAERTKCLRNLPCKIRMLGWLRFLDTYRTMCVTPEPEFRQLLLQSREFNVAA